MPRMNRRHMVAASAAAPFAAALAGAANARAATIDGTFDTRALKQAGALKAELIVL